MGRDEYVESLLISSAYARTGCRLGPHKTLGEATGRSGDVHGIRHSAAFMPAMSHARSSYLEG